MDLIGEDGIVYEIEGPDDDDDDDEPQVTGDIIGYADDGSPIVVGARRRRRRRRRRAGGGMVRVKQPPWRQSQIAPGVIAPDQGLLPLTLTGRPSNTFALGVSNITFEGVLQKPFRGERLLVSAVRTGTSATGLLLGQLFVGTDLQQLDVTEFDIEQLGDPNAFGVRLTMTPAQPGVLIRLVTRVTTALTTTDTILASVTLLGRLVH